MSAEAAAQNSNSTCQLTEIAKAHIRSGLLLLSRPAGTDLALGIDPGRI
jgi:hypothetical protein